MLVLSFGSFPIFYMSWNTFNQSLVRYPHLAFSMDLSLINSMNLEACSGKVSQAFEDMRRLERGEVVNVDEGVGSKWCEL